MCTSIGSTRHTRVRFLNLILATTLPVYVNDSDPKPNARDSDVTESSVYSKTTKVTGQNVEAGLPLSRPNLSFFSPIQVNSSKGNHQVGQVRECYGCTHTAVPLTEIFGCLRSYLLISRGGGFIELPY